MSRYVQHVSGQGKKWELVHEFDGTWTVEERRVGSSIYFDLPKSEYVLCEPPEVWRDVTHLCSFQHGDLMTGPEEGGHAWMILTSCGTIYPGEYRLRKVQTSAIGGENGCSTWAFFVERKE